MNQIDAHKLTIILRDASERLAFLDSISRQDDLSSELAGYEISKLLKKQKNLENQYAELVKLRKSLTGIQNKKNLIDTQSKYKITHFCNDIHHLSMLLIEYELLFLFI